MLQAPRQQPLWPFKKIGVLLVDGATRVVLIADDFRHPGQLCVKLLRHDSLRQLNLKQLTHLSGEISPPAWRHKSREPNRGHHLSASASVRYQRR